MLTKGTAFQGPSEGSPGRRTLQMDRDLGDISTEDSRTCARNEGLESLAGPRSALRHVIKPHSLIYEKNPDFSATCRGTGSRIESMELSVSTLQTRRTAAAGQHRGPAGLV